jgi:glutaredoxin 3
MFTVYTKEGCPQCDNVKALLSTKQQPFHAVKIGADITLDAFRQSYPQVKAVPFIVAEDRVIGGMHELSKLFADK